MKKICALFLLLAAFAVSTRSQQQPVVWQSSERPSVRLGVRDKYEVLKGFEATFVVTESPTGRKYRKTVKVEGDEFGSVEFPGDFEVNDYSYRGKTFKWECLVGGRVVLSGRFVLATTSDLDPGDRPARRRRPARGGR
jgi:hypothetical protein